MSYNEHKTIVPVDVETEWVMEEAEKEMERDEGGLSLTEFYLKTWTEIDQTEERVRNQFGIIIKQLKNRRRGLTYALASRVQQDVRKQLDKQRGKKKSLDTLYGRVGFRNSKGTVSVTDRDAFFDWLDSQEPEIRNKLDECISRKVSKTTPIRNYIEDTGEVPEGISFIPASDKFYPMAEMPRLESEVTSNG